MARPVILTVGDPQVLHTTERDPRRRYVREYRVLWEDSDGSALDDSGRLKLRGARRKPPVPCEAEETQESRGALPGRTSFGVPATLGVETRDGG